MGREGGHRRTRERTDDGATHRAAPQPSGLSACGPHTPERCGPRSSHLLSSRTYRWAVSCSLGRVYFLIVALVAGPRVGIPGASSCIPGCLWWEQGGWEMWGCSTSPTSCCPQAQGSRLGQVLGAQGFTWGSRPEVGSSLHPPSALVLGKEPGPNS